MRDDWTSIGTLNNEPGTRDLLRHNEPMNLVVIESPYAPDLTWTTEENIAYAIRAMHDCLERGEAPYASHLLFTRPGILDDMVTVERELGITAGLVWGANADIIAVYIDHGISGGMRLGIAQHQRLGKRIMVRALDREVTESDIADVVGVR